MQKVGLERSFFFCNLVEHRCDIADLLSLLCSNFDGEREWSSETEGVKKNTRDAVLEDSINAAVKKRRRVERGEHLDMKENTYLLEGALRQLIFACELVEAAVDCIAAHQDRSNSLGVELKVLGYKERLVR